LRLNTVTNLATHGPEPAIHTSTLEKRWIAGPSLPQKGAVGIVIFVDRPSDFQKQIVMMENTEEVVMRGKDFGQIGPDLGFLRLPEESLGWLKAKNSFYNLPKHRADVLARKEPTASHVDSMTGIIHAFTKDAPTGRPSERRKEFTAIFCGARLAALRYPANYELYYYEPTNGPGFTLPKSFQGTSGGAVWRFYVAEKDGSVDVVDRRLISFFKREERDNLPRAKRDLRTLHRCNKREMAEGS
jgi:hypothetical protein